MVCQKIAKLVILLFAIAATNAPLERGFSQANCIALPVPENISGFGQHSDSINGLPLSEKNKLDALVVTIAASFSNPGCTPFSTIHIDGYADRDIQRGAAFEVQISADRAQTVKTYIEERINGKVSISTKGHGSQNRIVALEPAQMTDAQRLQNRRVVIALQAGSMPVPGKVELPLVSVEKGTDLPGSDYKTLTVVNSDECSMACKTDALCKAYTFRRPQCFLKSAVPARIESACCISGVKEPFPPTRTALVPIAGGVWNSNTRFTIRGGQSLLLKLTNTNVIGTQIVVEEGSTGKKHAQIILPLQTVELPFSVFQHEPRDWNFAISSDSDAFLVTWALLSSWALGDPPNPLEQR